MLQYFSCYGEAEGNGLGLTERGREAVRLLGEHLRSRGFCGQVLFSSEAPCRESAACIAAITGSALECAEDLRGADGGESDGDFSIRIRRGYRDRIGKWPERELLFLTGRRASEILVDIFAPKIPEGAAPFDCALTSLDPLRWKTVPVVYDTSFLPSELITPTRWEVGKRLTRTSDQTLFFEGLKDLKGPRLLHIGDTESATYPFFRDLIEAVRPQVILHTGDLADEVKIERHPELLGEYTEKAGRLLEWMRNSGAELVLVVGNHDDAAVLRRLAPEARILPPNSEITLCGIPCRVGHKVREMTFDRRLSFFGHGLAGDPWRHALNLPDGPYRFSSAYGTYVVEMTEERDVGEEEKKKGRRFLFLPRFCE
ncbi:MAG: metallophosphoesterase [Clostridia bacterium]|nr:metallophosphoesterase [Clostridia bacterium]